MTSEMKNSCQFMPPVRVILTLFRVKITVFSLNLSFGVLREPYNVKILQDFFSKTARKFRETISSIMPYVVVTMFSINNQCKSQFLDQETQILLIPPVLGNF